MNDQDYINIYLKEKIVDYQSIVEIYDMYVSEFIDSDNEKIKGNGQYLYTVVHGFNLYLDLMFSDIEYDNNMLLNFINQIYQSLDEKDPDDFSILDLLIAKIYLISNYFQNNGTLEFYDDVIYEMYANCFKIGLIGTMEYNKQKTKHNNPYKN